MVVSQAAARNCFVNRAFELRKELGLTQAKLARLTGESQSHISDRERGRRELTRLALMALLYLRSLNRAQLNALLADPSKLEDER